MGKEGKGEREGRGWERKGREEVWYLLFLGIAMKSPPTWVQLFSGSFFLNDWVGLSVALVAYIGLGTGKGAWETDCSFDSGERTGLQPMGGLLPVRMSEAWALSESCLHESKSPGEIPRRCCLPEGLRKALSSWLSAVSMGLYASVRLLLTIQRRLLNTKSIHSPQDSTGCVYMMPKRPANWLDAVKKEISQVDRFNIM